MASPQVAVGLLALSVLGALVALYFVAVTYRWMRPDAAWLPNVCRMDEGTCARIVDTPYARVLGLPNAVYGLAWYAAVAAAAGVALATGVLPLYPLLLLASVGTVALGAYLVWALLYRLRTPCPLCFLGHAINASLLVLLAIA